ncbi:MAG: hypothetical protein MUE44_04260 [Oscillatoriaceae cyanobacterium Prado104]|jgi:hypothetical protein|nr:hypothetical protein [Oscillatoriaceae cyanobacterium Prado104]
MCFQPHSQLLLIEQGIPENDIVLAFIPHSLTAFSTAVWSNGVVKPQIDERY